MAKPVIVVIDDDAMSLQALTGELESRYGAHYQVVSGSSAEVGLARLADLKAAGQEVPLVLADQSLPKLSGTEMLARVRDIYPTARRGPLIAWRDRSTPAPILDAAALGWLEFYVAKPMWSPDEEFHRVITGSLEEWWREQGGQFAMVTVIGDDPSARVHEILDVLARNNLPFGGTGRLGLRGVGGTAHGPARAGGVRRPGRNKFADQELSGLPQWCQRRGTGAARLRTGVDVRHRLHLRQPRDVAFARRELLVVGLEDGSEIAARAVVIASGVAYRRLEVPELEALVGAGVFYGAGTIEARAVTGKPVFVVGGGNSAGQAALHLSKYAQHVTILVRSPSLASSMSDYLIRQIEAAPDVDIRYRCEIAGGGGAGHLEDLLLRDRDSGVAERMPAAGVFVLIGAQPFTDWLPDAIRRDQWGFILTGPDTGQHWSQERPPFLLETTTPGVFAVGDVRHGSMKRVASAVGDGSTAVRLIHDYLALAPEPEGHETR